MVFSFQKHPCFHFSNAFNTKQETLCVVTIAMICSTLASLWKSQYFQRPIYNPVEDLWWSLYCENIKPLSIFTKRLHLRCSHYFLKVLLLLIHQTCWTFKRFYFHVATHVMFQCSFISLTSIVFEVLEYLKKRKLYKWLFSWSEFWYWTKVKKGKICFY